MLRVRRSFEYLREWTGGWVVQDPVSWVVVCRDLAGRRGRLVVVPTPEGRIALVGPGGVVVTLTLLAAGRLRGVLRDAVVALDRPGPSWFEVALFEEGTS